MDIDRSSSRWLMAWAAGLGFAFWFLFFDRLGERDLWASHEARAGQNALSVLNGHWLSPRLIDGQIELQKPPLFYWTVAAFGILRGQVDAVAVRLPSALSAVATVALLFVFLAHRQHRYTAPLAAVILATSHHFTWIGRTGRIDIPLTFTTALAIICLWRGTDWRVQFVGFMAIAAGILLKGPIGAVLPAVVLGVDWLVHARQEPFSLRFHSLIWGIPFVILASLPWFVAAHQVTDGEFTRIFFVHHNLQRATGSSASLASHPWWLYPVRSMIDIFPWSLAIPFAGWSFCRDARFRSDRVAQFGLVWFLSIEAILSLSRFKRADYLLPAYPGLAIWLAVWSESWSEKWVRRSCISVLSAACVLWLFFLRTEVVRLDADREKKSFAVAMESHVPPSRQVLFFRVEDHLLAFHLHRPVHTLLEWENLDKWVAKAESTYVVMSADSMSVWRQYITSGELEELERWNDGTERSNPRDLVLVRTRPHSTNSNDATGSYRRQQATP